MTELIKTQYKTLFKVEISHEFYLDGQGNHVDHEPDLLFEPTPECQNILKKYHLLIKQEKEGFYILGQVDNVDSSRLLISINDEVKFTFTISLLNSYFVNFSELPIQDTRGKLYRFTNLQENIVNGKLTLAQNAGGAVSDADLIAVKAKQFTERRQIITPAVITLKDRHDIPILSETIVDPLSVAGIYNVDLNGFEDGVYSLTINGVTETFFSSDHCVAANAFGVIEIFNGSEPPDSYKFITNSVVTPITYVIPFSARKCSWIYNLVGADTSQHNYSIEKNVSTSTNIAFVTISTQPYNSIISQRPFKSNQKIDLRSKDNYCSLQIDLYDPIKLSQPSYRNIKSDGVNSYYVESFIYI